VEGKSKFHWLGEFPGEERVENKPTGKGATLSRTALGCFEISALAAEGHAVKPTRLMSPPGTYFVTFSTFQRRRFFVVESYAKLFLQTLYGYRRQGRFTLHAFVLMPNHVHLLFTPAADVTLERAMQLIKGGYSHAVGVEVSRREIWQKGFTDHRIRDAQDFAGHRLYIHQNPVMRKLVANPAEYRYGSAFPGFRLDAWPPAAEAAICVGA
jgi:putative transposase